VTVEVVGLVHGSNTVSAPVPPASFGEPLTAYGYAAAFESRSRSVADFPDAITGVRLPAIAKLRGNDPLLTILTSTAPAGTTTGTRRILEGVRVTTTVATSPPELAKADEGSRLVVTLTTPAANPSSRSRRAARAGTIESYSYATAVAQII
jgi:hypothetical protein